MYVIFSGQKHGYNNEAACVNLHCKSVSITFNCLDLFSGFTECCFSCFAYNIIPKEKEIERVKCEILVKALSTFWFTLYILLYYRESCVCSSH